MTITGAREILRDFGAQLTDEEISALIGHLTGVCDVLLEEAEDGGSAAMIGAESMQRRPLEVSVS